MTITQGLAVASLLVGSIMGLLVFAAAVAAGHQRRLPCWLGGTVWGVLSTGLLLTDCLHQGSPGPISEAAFPLFFAGIGIWPVLLSWRQQRWLIRWLYAQFLLLLTAFPGFAAAVAAAYCTLA